MQVVKGMQFLALFPQYLLLLNGIVQISLYVPFNSYVKHH